MAYCEHLAGCRSPGYATSARGQGEGKLSRGGRAKSKPYGGAWGPSVARFGETPPPTACGPGGGRTGHRQNSKGTCYHCAAGPDSRPVMTLENLSPLPCGPPCAQIQKTCGQHPPITTHPCGYHARFSCSGVTFSVPSSLRLWKMSPSRNPRRLKPSGPNRRTLYLRCDHG